MRDHNKTQGIKPHHQEGEVASIEKIIALYRHQQYNDLFTSIWITSLVFESYGRKLSIMKAENCDPIHH